MVGWPWHARGPVERASTSRDEGRYMTTQDICQVCYRRIRVAIYKGTDVCSDNCRKVREGDTEHLVLATQ